MNTMKMSFTRVVTVIISVVCMCSLCGAGKLTQAVSDKASGKSETKVLEENSGRTMLVMTSEQGRFITDKDDVYTVGEISRDYVNLSDFDVSSYPELKKVLDGFNKEAKKDYTSSLPEFIKTSQGYDEMMVENLGDDYSHDGCIDTAEAYVMRADDDYMSFVVYKDAYWGGAEEYKMYECYNYESQTGRELKLDDVVEDDSELDEILRTELLDKYGRSAFNVNLTSKSRDKKNDEVLYDSDNSDYLKWCLTPTGIDVFFDSDELYSKDGEGAFVQLSFDKYPDMLNSDFASGSEYMIPFINCMKYYADVDEDGKEEEIEINLEIDDAEEFSDKYACFTISVDGKEYTDFAVYRFYEIIPYYVHRTDGNYLSILTRSYNGSNADIIKFIDGEPIFYKRIPGSMFDSTWVDTGNDDFNYVGKAFTNPLQLDALPTFEELFCDNYSYTDYEGGDENVNHYEICAIDGHYYMNYISDYGYGASEIELLQEEPIEVGGDFYYMVKLHNFSGFAFAGDYLGGAEGDVCYLQSGANADLIISPGYDFDELCMFREEDYDMHPILDNATKNTTASKLVGAWRFETKMNRIPCEIYMEFNSNGTCKAAIKAEGYPVAAGYGIYTLNGNDGEISLEVFGYADQPFDFSFSVDEKTGAPTLSGLDNLPIHGLFSSDNLVTLEKTESGESDFAIEEGRAGRGEELQDMWEEYSSEPDEIYDYTSEDLETLADELMRYLNVDYCDVLAIEDGGSEGLIWLYGYNKVKDGRDTLEIGRDYAYYNFGTGDWYLINGSEWNVTD